MLYLLHNVSAHCVALDYDWNMQMSHINASTAVKCEANVLLKHPRSFGALQKSVCLDHSVCGDQEHHTQRSAVTSYTTVCEDGMGKHICVDRGGMQCTVRHWQKNVWRDSSRD